MKERTLTFPCPGIFLVKMLSIITLASISLLYSAGIASSGSSFNLSNSPSIVERSTRWPRPAFLSSLALVVLRAPIPKSRSTGLNSTFSEAAFTRALLYSVKRFSTSLVIRLSIFIEAPFLSKLSVRRPKISPIF